MARMTCVAARLDDRIWPEPNSGCFLWLGAHNGKGYSQIKIRGKRFFVHRLVYQLTKGAIPSGMVVMHKCDNPACCNPNHLTIGTPKDNTRDAVRKGRMAFGQRHYHSVFTEDDVREIRQSSEPTASLMKRYGVSRGAIDGIRDGRNWRHVR